MESKKNSLFATGTALGIGAIMLAQSALGHQPDGILPDHQDHTHQESPQRQPDSTRTAIATSATGNSTSTSTTAPPT